MEEEIHERSMSFENHKKVLTQSIENFLTRRAFVDMTLVCSGGRKIKAHRTVLAACSPLFENILIDINDQSHPVLVFNDISEGLMVRIIEFIYKGKTSIPHALTEVFLNIARKLQIRGLENIISQEDLQRVSIYPVKENMSKSYKKRKFMSRESSARSEKLETNTQLPEKLPLKINTGTEIKVVNPFALKGLRKDGDSTSTEDDLCVPGPSKFNSTGKETVPLITSNVPDPVPQEDDSDIEFIEDNLNPSIVVVNDTQNSNSVQWLSKEQMEDKRESVNKKSASDEYDSDDSEIRASHRKKKKNTNNISSYVEELSKDAHAEQINPVDRQNLSDTSESPELITAVAMEDLPKAMVDTVKQEITNTNLTETEYLQKPFQVLSRYCVVCKVFKKNIGLHVKRLHNLPIRRKEFTCKNCSKIFYLKHCLELHKCTS